MARNKTGGSHNTKLYDSLRKHYPSDNISAEDWSYLLASYGWKQAVLEIDKDDDLLVQVAREMIRIKKEDSAISGITLSKVKVKCHNAITARREGKAYTHLLPRKTVLLAMRYTCTLSSYCSMNGDVVSMLASIDMLQLLQVGQPGVVVEGNPTINDEPPLTQNKSDITELRDDLKKVKQSISESRIINRKDLDDLCGETIKNLIKDHMEIALKNVKEHVEAIIDDQMVRNSNSDTAISLDLDEPANSMADSSSSPVRFRKRCASSSTIDAEEKKPRFHCD